MGRAVAESQSRTSPLPAAVGAKTPWLRSRPGQGEGAIVAEAHRQHFPRGQHRRSDRFAGLKIPQPRGLVAASRQRRGPVGADGHADNYARMVQGRRGSFARVNVPELGGVVVAAGEYVQVVWGKGHRPNPIVVQQRFADQPPGRHLPDVRRIIGAPSDDVAPIRAERGTEVLPNPVRNGPAPVASDPGSGATRDERWVKVAQGQGGIALRQRSSRARWRGRSQMRANLSSEPVIRRRPSGLKCTAST